MCLRAVISQRLVRNTNGKLIPAVEILLNTSLIADLIKNDEIEKIRDAIGQSVSPGSQTFEQALYKLFKSGQITKEEAMRNADSASNLASLVDYSQTAKMKVFTPKRRKRQHRPTQPILTASRSTSTRTTQAHEAVRHPELHHGKKGAYMAGSARVACEFHDFKKQGVTPAMLSGWLKQVAGRNC